MTTPTPIKAGERKPMGLNDQFVMRLRDGNRRVADERTRRELREAADIIEKWGDTLDAIKTLCEGTDPFYAVRETLKQIDQIQHRLKLGNAN